ncbi:hypothetical protein LINPERPRIM_LOCUS2234, partial [Linum perenne]
FFCFSDLGGNIQFPKERLDTTQVNFGNNDAPVNDGVADLMGLVPKEAYPGSAVQPSSSATKFDLDALFVFGSED